nr:LxmA leader domain family RiPP [Herbidospora sakaeratensis]
MSAESLMEGADAYTSLAEVATTEPAESPEATPITISITTFFSSTIILEC